MCKQSLTENEMGASKHWCLQRADEEAADIQLGHVGHAALGKGHDAPCNLQRGQQISSTVFSSQFSFPMGHWWQCVSDLQLGARYKKQKGDLKGHVGAVIADIEVIQLVAKKPELLLEATGVRIADIRLVLAGY